MDPDPWRQLEPGQRADILAKMALLRDPPVRMGPPSEAWVPLKNVKRPRPPIITVQRRLEAFAEEADVRALVICNGVAGCPHEEAVDFPEGGHCPECTFWEGIQGSGGFDELRFAGGVTGYRRKR